MCVCDLFIMRHKDPQVQTGSGERRLQLLPHLDPLICRDVVHSDGHLRSIQQNLHFGAGRVLTGANADRYHPAGTFLTCPTDQAQIEERSTSANHEATFTYIKSSKPFACLLLLDVLR